MRRRILAVSALLAVLVACRDGPAELTAPLEGRTTVQPDVTVSQDAVTTVVQLLDDPFVRELMDGVGAHAASLHDAARDASISRTTAHVLTLSRVLALTRGGLSVRPDDGEEDPDDEILRAALELVLDDAAALLEPRPQSVEEEEQRGPGRGTPLRSGASNDEEQHENMAASRAWRCGGGRCLAVCADTRTGADTRVFCVLRPQFRCRVSGQPARVPG